MKKLIFAMAIASLAVSCKKVAAGGNKNAIKMEEGVERYNDDKEQVKLQPVRDSAGAVAAAPVVADSAAAASPAAVETKPSTSAPVNNATTSEK